MTSIRVIELWYRLAIPIDALSESTPARGLWSGVEQIGVDEVGRCRCARAHVDSFRVKRGSIVIGCADHQPILQLCTIRVLRSTYKQNLQHHIFLPFLLLLSTAQELARKAKLKGI